MAGSPWTLPEGATSLYAGLGASTFATGMSGLSRDRYVQARASAWVGRGITQRTQVEASLPLAWTGIVEDPDQGPCPTAGDYCKSSLAPGPLEIAGTTRLHDKTLPFALRYGLHTDVWNAGRRGRWTNPGQGTVAAVVDGLAEVASQPGEVRWVGGLSIGAVVPWPTPAEGADGTVQRWAPAPAVRGSLIGRFSTDGLALELGVMAQQRMWGERFGADWVSVWRPQIDRWRVTRWGELRPQAKVSVALPHAMGVHIGVSRSVWVTAGPPDLWDVSVGVHKYWAAAE